MANQPDRFDKFVVPEGQKKIAFERDTKVPNAGTFVLQREDHTVGNMVRQQLHTDKTVHFAGYKVPHPMEYTTLVKIHTDGTKTPIDAMQDALQCLDAELADIGDQWERGVLEHNPMPTSGY